MHLSGKLIAQGLEERAGARTIASTFLLLAVVLQSLVPPNRSPLVGVWKRVAETYVGPDTTWTITKPQPSLYMFTRASYSMMWVPGTKPRKLLTSADPAELVGAFDSFRANSGTYEVRDSIVTVHPVVARVPNLMAGRSIAYVYRVRADSLWLTVVYPWAPGSTRTAKVLVHLVRLE